MLGPRFWQILPCPGETIFALLQLSEDESLFEAYTSRLSRVEDLNIFEEPQKLQAWASSICTMLEKVERKQRGR